MPRLNVHHKVYYRNRELWDYQDDELVTLCEDCHHYIHSLKDFGIPIIEKNANGNNMLIGRTQPKSYNPVFDHTDLSTFKPLALVKENLWGDGLRRDDLIKFKLAQSENKQWYDYHEGIPADAWVLLLKPMQAAVWIAIPKETEKRVCEKPESNAENRGNCADNKSPESLK